MNCIGVNDKNGSLPLRERYAFSAEERRRFHGILKETCGCTGAVILSTCNRSEIYFCGDAGRVEQALAEYKGIPKSEVLAHIYSYAGEQALRHLFFVACGLDSMVLGEDEILRQAKDAYGIAKELGCTCNEINIAFQGAFGCAKDIKTNTLLSRTPVSVGTLAANRIEAFLRENGGGYVLLVGITGKIGSILAKNLLDKGIREMIGTTRRHAGVFRTFSDNEIQMVDFADRYRYVDGAAVVVSATAGPHYTFVADRIRGMADCGRPRLFIDLAVPRDMDAEIGDIPGITLLNIDDFRRMAASNNALKLKEMDKAELILGGHVEETSKSISMSAFMERHKEAFAALSGQSFGSVVYRLRDELSGEQWNALLKAIERLVE